MKITKEMLPEISHVDLALENCEDFNIQAEDILDIRFDEIQFGVGPYGGNKVHDGRLVVSKRAFEQLSSFVEDDYDKNPPWDGYRKEDYYFCNRITKYNDICQVHIYFKNGSKVWFFVDYDPIESELLGYVIEDSNCPSSELDENGDMLILFGNSSHTFKRVDNDYYNVIDDLSTLLPQRLKGVITVRIESAGNEGDRCFSPEHGLFFRFRMQNSAYRNKYLPLQFFNVSKLLFNFEFNCSETMRLWISPTKNGKYFIQIGDCCNFYCKKIKVFDGF